MHQDELKRQMLMLLEAKLNGLITRFSAEYPKLDDPEKEAEIMKSMTNTLAQLIKNFEKFYKIKDQHAHLFEEIERK